MNINDHVYPDFMNTVDEGIEESGMKGHNISSSLTLDLVCDFIPRQRMSDLMTEGHRSVRSFGSTRLLPSLHPSPGKMPGSRKRRVNASNGPNSLSEGTPVRSSSPLAHVTPILDRNIPFTADFAETSPMITDFARTSPTSPQRLSPYFGATPPIRNTMTDLTMTPPRLPVQTSAFGLAAPATPEITTFKNMSIRSPILSKSPGSSFSQYSNKGFASPLGQLASPVFPSSPSPGQMGRLSSPSFQSSPSPRQVRLKILSNCASSQNLPAKQIPEQEVSKQCLDPPRVKLSKFSTKTFASVPSLRMGGMRAHPSYSPQESQSSTLMTSPQVSPNDSYARCNGNRETIAQELKQPWPILDDGNFINEAVWPPHTPPLLPRRMPFSDHLKKNSPISRIPTGCATKQSTIKKYPSFPAHDAKDKIESRMGDEMNTLLHGFMSERPKTPEYPGRDVSERARNHIPRNINITQNSRVTNPMERQDSMIFSDDDSCYHVVMNKNKKGREPPIKLSLGQQIGRKKSNSNGNAHSHRKSAQKSLLSPGSPLSNEALDEMLNDALGTGGNDTVGSLSDDDEGSNSFFLTSPKRCFDETTPQAKETVRLDSRLPPQDYGMFSSKRMENRQKKTRISPSEDEDWMHSSKVEMNQGHYQDNNENVVSLSEFTSDHGRESSNNDKLRRQTLLSNMDVICENSVSNASLVGMIYLPNESALRSRLNIRSCSESSRSSSDESCKFDRPSSRSSSDESSSADCPASLRRNQSDQSLNSIGLCLEGIPLYSELNSRDMVTPPVIRYDSLTPPPIKNTKLGAAFLLKHQDNDFM